MSATPLNFEIGSGDNAPILSWQMPFAILGSVFELVVNSVEASTTEVLTLRSDSSPPELELDTADNIVSWEITSAQSAELPIGQRSRYTLRRIVPEDDGEVRYYAHGWIKVVEGPVSTTDPAVVIVQGAQGVPGDEEATAAAVAAAASQAAAAASASQASTARNTATGAAAAALVSQNAAADSASTAATYAAAAAATANHGFLTKAAMDAVTSYPVNDVAEVLADPTPANNGLYTWNGSAWVSAGLGRIGTLEARPYVHIMLNVTGTADAYTGTPAPALPDPVPEGTEIVIRPTFTNNQDATLLGRPMVYPDATQLYPGAVVADSYNWFMRLQNTWVLKENPTMAAPVTWFDEYAEWDSTPVELLPASPNLKDFIFVNNAEEPNPGDPVPNVRLAFGGADPTATRGILVKPGGTWTSDTPIPTPVRGYSAVAGTPITCYFSTTNGRNPVADAGFDALLLRNGTTLTQAWETALRNFYTAARSIIVKSQFFYVFVGPDGTLALENWAADNAATVTGTIVRDSKTGFPFAGNASAVHVSPGMGQGDGTIGQNNFTLGYGTTDTTPASNSTAFAVSNGVMQMCDRASNLHTRANTTGNDTFVPVTRGGLLAMTRRDSAGYDAYADGEVHTFVRASTSISDYDFQIGVGVSTTNGSIVSTSYYTGPADIFWFSSDLTTDEKDELKAARSTLLAAIAGL